MNKRSEDIETIVGCITLIAIASALLGYLVIIPFGIMWLWPIFHTDLHITWFGAVAIETIILVILGALKR